MQTMVDNCLFWLWVKHVDEELNGYKKANLMEYFASRHQLV